MFRFMRVGCALAAALALTSYSRATVYNYQFTSGTTFTIGNTTEMVSGTFSIDTAASATNTNGSVTVTGVAPYAGTFTEANISLNNNQVNFNPNAGAGPSFVFDNSFGAENLSLTAVLDSFFAPTVGFERVFASGVSGGASLVTPAVPEPSTWAMMILGFCGLGFLAHHRRNQTTALTAA
jgi:hypothetical protein